MNVGIFAVITLVSGYDEQLPLIDDFRGLVYRAPLLGSLLIFFLISLIGIPFTGGFFGKFYSFTAAVDGGAIWLAIIGLLNSGLAAAYYLRLALVSAQRPLADGPRTAPPKPVVGIAVGAALFFAVAATLVLGIIPGATLDAAQTAAHTLQAPPPEAVLTRCSVTISSMKLGELASRLGAELRGNPDLEITGVKGIEEAGPTEITFVANPRYTALARTTRAAAVVVDPDFQEISAATLRIKNPYHAFSRALGLFYQPPAYPPGIHPTAVIDPTAEIGPDAHIGAYAVVGPQRPPRSPRHPPASRRALSRRSSRQPLLRPRPRRGPRKLRPRRPRDPRKRRRHRR